VLGSRVPAGLPLQSTPLQPASGQVSAHNWVSFSSVNIADGPAVEVRLRVARPPGCLLEPRPLAGHLPAFATPPCAFSSCLSPARHLTSQLPSCLAPAQVGATLGLLDTGTPSLELPAAAVDAYMQAVQAAVAASPQLTINSVSHRQTVPPA